MKFEMRIRKFSEADEWLKISTDFLQSVALGDDGCPHKCPKGQTAFLLRDQVEKRGLQFRFVTPRLPESHIDAFLETMRGLVAQGRNFALTANDPGFLHACFKEGLLPETVTLGRTVARSIQDCPWIAHVVPAVTKDSDKIRLQNNMSDPIKMDFFSRYNAHAIESNWMSHDPSSFARIRSRGYAIGIFVGSPSVAYARACPTARHLNLKVPECASSCDKPIGLSMTQMSLGTEFRDAPLDGQNPFSLRLLGNVLFQDSFHPPTAAELLTSATYPIAETWRFEGASDLEEFLRKQIDALQQRGD